MGVPGRRGSTRRCPRRLDGSGSRGDGEDRTVPARELSPSGPLRSSRCVDPTHWRRGSGRRPYANQGSQFQPIRGAQAARLLTGGSAPARHVPLLGRGETCPRSPRPTLAVARRVPNSSSERTASGGGGGVSRDVQYLAPWRWKAAASSLWTPVLFGLICVSLGGFTEFQNTGTYRKVDC